MLTQILTISPIISSLFLGRFKNTLYFCGLTACSSDDSIVKETPVVTPETTNPVCRVIIPATIGGVETRAVDFGTDGATITTTFKTTDIIYAYNKTQDYFFDHRTFSPDADAQSANLRDTYDPTSNYLGSSEHWNINDEIVLMYKLSVFVNNSESYYGYTQLGTAASASAHDFAVAMVTVTGKTGTGTMGDPIVVTTSKAAFTNLGSMFRQRFTFSDADDNPIATPTVTKLVIRDANNKIVNVHYPLKASAEQDLCDGGIYLKNPDLSGDVYWAMRFAEGAGKITFLAYTSDNKVYEGAKDAPASGFANGKYYHGNTPIMMKPSTNFIQPTVTGSVYYDTTWNCIEINGDATVSGYSTGWYMYIDKGASGRTLTFDNASLYRTTHNSYIYIVKPPITFNLQGDNAYTALGDVCAIDCAGTLTFTGNGTLALTCKKNDNYSTKGFFHRSALSIEVASGHTLTVSDGVDNGDGTWTWVYTVRPTE